MAAKQKPTILKSFFEGHRRKAFLVDWKQTRDSRDIDTIKLELRLPLLNEPLLGMNAGIGDPFSLMAKKDSRTDRSVVNVEIKGMTFEVFCTDTSNEHWTSTTGAHFKKLWLTAEGEEEKKEVNLHVVLYVPGSVEFRDWAWQHMHSNFHLEAAYSQSELDLKGAPDDDEEFEDIPDEIPADPTKKHGPKDLGAFHEKQ